MRKNQTIKVGISIGDINGIGLEIILKTLQDKNILDFFTPVIFGSTKMLNQVAKQLDFKNINLNGIKHPKEAIDKKINVVNIFSEPFTIEYGQATPEAGKIAVTSFQNAVDALQKGEVDVLVTAPFNKDNIQSEDYKHPGHTEYLGEVFQEEPLMILTGDKLTVALVTQHIALKEVPKYITKENIISKTKQFYQTLKQDYYLMRPKIAILGLNPHASDNGLMGNEEKEFIIPAIEQLNEEGILAFGPYPSDSFFVPKNLDAFDGVLAMYHDQGLIPFKTLHFQDGVNFSGGLPKVRTSPDHGVAYDIAGKGIADDTSFKEAIFKAIEIFNNRNQDAIDNANPLQNLSEEKDERKPRDKSKRK